MVSKGTHIIIPLVKHLEDERWEAKITEQNGSKIKLSVNSPANAVIGLYGLTVTTCTVKGEATSTHNSSKTIVMLFNPWCEGKLVVGWEWGRWFSWTEGRNVGESTERSQVMAR